MLETRLIPNDIFESLDCSLRSLSDYTHLIRLMWSPVTGRWFEVMSLYFVMSKVVDNKWLIHTKYIYFFRWMNGGGVF